MSVLSSCLQMFNMQALVTQYMIPFHIRCEQAHWDRLSQNPWLYKFLDDLLILVVTICATSFLHACKHHITFGLEILKQWN